MRAETEYITCLLLWSGTFCHALEVIAGFRTTLRQDAAQRYVETHQQIPEAVANVLRDEGLIAWRIWIDGSTVFHMIETRHGLDDFFDRLGVRGPIDAAWDAIIHELVDDRADASATLALVWGMDSDRQWHDVQSDPAS